MAMSKLARGGFECEFVEKPPKFFQTECLVCLQILRSPYLLVCCGKSLCQPCIERIKKDNKPCPHCNEQNFTDVPNKGLQQSLYQCPVYCSNKEEGCKWSGELGELDKHLNLEPQPERQLEGCDFATVKCIHCTYPFQRQQINNHQIEHCPSRPFSCEYCKEYKSTYNNIVNIHVKECGCVPVECTNGCGESPQRQDLDTHIARDCPLTVIECDFQYAGCDVKLPRKDMPEHLTTAMVSHMSMLAITNKTLVARVEELERENKLLKNENKTLKKDLTQQIQDHQLLRKDVTAIYQHLRLLPVGLTMPNVERHKTTKEEWLSPPFYTHFQGYKLRTRVNITPHSYILNCVCVSLQIYILKGEFDEILQWPCCGEISIDIVPPQGIKLKLKSHTFNIRGSKVKKDTEFAPTSERHHTVCVPNHYIHKETLTFQITKFTQK